MSGERREFVRQRGPFDGSWSDSSRERACRITDLSPNGCFVDSPDAPPPGTAVIVSVMFGEARFTVPGQVAYLDPRQGFGARFLPSESTRALAYAMGPTEPDGGLRGSSLSD